MKKNINPSAKLTYAAVWLCWNSIRIHMVMPVPFGASVNLFLRRLFRIKSSARAMLFFNVAALALGGCGQPRVVKEQVNYPQATRTGVPYRVDAKALSSIAWWKKFKDPELDRLIMQALASNYRIQSAYATIEQAQAQLKASYYAWIPTFDAAANGFTGGTWNTHATPQRALANNAFFSTLSNPRLRGYYAGFVPHYTVNALNNMSIIKSAQASLAIQQAQAQLTRLGIISQMSGTYFMLLSQREQLAVETALVGDLKKLRQLEQIRFQKGASDLEHLTEVDQQLAQEATRIPQIEQIIAQSENTIRLLLNQNPGAIPTSRTVHSFHVRQLIPQQLPSSVLKNRPDIMIATNNVKMAYAQLGVAYAEFFPSISLTGLVGNSSVELKNLLKLSTNLWLAQATAAMKIVNLGSYQQIKSAKAGLKATVYHYLETLHSAFADVDDALANEHHTQLAYGQAAQGYAAAQQAYSLAAAQYKAGASDYRQVVKAKINCERSKLALIQAKAQLLDSIVQLYDAVAGGAEVI